MAVASTATYNLTRDGLIAEACQLVGVCAPDGTPTQEQFTSLTRSLNVLVKGLALRGVIITATERVSTTLTAGTSTYSYAADTVDVLPQEMYVRQTSGSTNTDTIVENMARAQYMQLVDKATQGRPTRCLIERATATIQAILWPVPDSLSTTFTSTRIRLLADMTTGSNNADLPSKYQRMLVLGIAHDACLKFGLSIDQAQYFKGLYDEESNVALADSTERGNLTFRPMTSIRPRNY